VKSRAVRIDHASIKLNPRAHTGGALGHVADGCPSELRLCYNCESMAVLLNPFSDEIMELNGPHTGKQPGKLLKCVPFRDGGLIDRGGKVMNRMSAPSLAPVITRNATRAAA
jgi:hypothetical protein